MLVVGSPTTNFNRLVLIIRRLRGLRQGLNAEWPWLRDFVCDDATVTAALMLLRFVEEVKWSPEAEWRTNLSRRLTYGDVPPAKALQLAQIALDQPFPEGLPPPEYTEEVSGLVHQLIARSPVAVWTPILVDYLLTSAAIRSAGTIAVPGVPAELQVDAAAIARRVISTIAYAVGATTVVRAPVFEVTAETSAAPSTELPQNPTELPQNPSTDAGDD
jgi:hypothetical protein